MRKRSSAMRPWLAALLTTLLVTCLAPHAAFAQETSDDSVRRITPREEAANTDYSLTSSLGPLALILAIVFVGAWLWRRAHPDLTRAAPSQAIQLLGHRSIGQKQAIHLIRIGQKILVVGMSGDRMETLSEIDDPHEIELLTGLCRAGETASSTTSFGELFRRRQSQSTNRSEEASPTSSPASWAGQLPASGDVQGRRA